MAIYVKVIQLSRKAPRYRLKEGGSEGVNQKSGEMLRAEAVKSHQSPVRVNTQRLARAGRHSVTELILLASYA